MSKDGAKVIVLIGAKEHVLKTPSFAKRASGLKHFREIGSDRKRTYLKAFPKRFDKLKQHLEIVKVLRYSEESIRYIDDYLHRVQPSLVIVDDHLYHLISYPNKLLEGNIRREELRRLLVIADNLANYFRLILKNDPKKFREELRRFEK